jgi:hypothetical protein
MLGMLFAWQTGASAVQLTLAWTDNSTNETGFAIERGTVTTGPFAEIGESGPGATSFTDLSVVAATTYCYRTRAFNAAAYSGYTNVACAAVSQTFGLAVVKIGAGTGTVTSAPAGIACGASCSASYPSGTAVTLSAAAATGSTFTGWSGGGCSGAGTCTVTLTAGTTVSATFTGPAAPPTVTITAPTAAAAYSTSAGVVTLAGSATSAADVTQVSWANDRGASGTAAGTTSWSAAGIPLQAGLNVLTVTARDAGGNAGSATLAVTYDATAPSANITAPLAGATVAGTVAVTAAVSDNVGVLGVQFLLDGAALGAEQSAGVSLAWNTTAVANGAHTLAARVRDAAGNTTLTASVAVTVANFQATGLVAAYGFDEGAGGTVGDASGNGNTGTLEGPTWTSEGRFGSALMFNGRSDYVDLGNAEPLQVTGSMTVSAWVKANSWQFSEATIVSKRTAEGIGFQLDSSSDTAVRTASFKLTSSTGAELARYGSTPLVLDQWYYVTGVYDAAAQSLSVYLNGLPDNGILVGSVSGAQANAPVNVTIGQSAGTFQFNGVIDEVRLYGRALSQAEIQTDMATAVGSGNTAPPAMVTLTVGTAGTGSGTVTSAPAGISCGTTCSWSYASGTSMSLTATPVLGSTFAGWTGGGCSGAGACLVNLTAATTINATFTANQQTGAIRFVQSNYAAPQASLATVTVTFPAAQAAGNLNVVVVGWNDTKATVSSVTDSAGNAYAVAAGRTARPGKASQAIYYAKNIRGGANLVTVKFSAAAVSPDIRILEYSGLDTVKPLVAAASGTGSSSTSSTGSLKTTVPNVLLVAANVVGTATSVPGAGFTSRVLTAPEADIVEDQIVSTPGTYRASARLSASGYWVMQLVAFRAAN